MKDLNQKAEAARLFFDIDKTLRRSMRRCFEDIGITMPQSLVISALFKSSEMKLTDLSKKINLSNSTVSGIIDRLERQQLVVRTRSEEDRRVVYLKVTPKLKELKNEFHSKAEKSFEELLGTGSPEEIEKIFEGLKTLREILRNIE
ncbi:MAG: MarR family transcriptional regulator [Ruminiclostridium sp.]|nr:MarR family transcriptional regulator [Ruminiclostridium sp.]